MKKLVSLLFIVFLSINSFAFFLTKNTIPNIVEKVSPAVVMIKTQRVFKVFNPFSFDPFNDEITQKAEGSGFIIDKSGLILTNAHVVDNADEIYVVLNRNQKYKAKVLGITREYDLALLKINPPSNVKLPVLELGDSDKVKIGEFVVAIGNPFGLERTVTVGVISAKNRRITVDRGITLVDLFQTDAAINFGNSGGPLINLEGKVIGVNTAVAQSAHGIGFAIPINIAKRFVHDFLNYGRPRFAFLGVYTMPVTINFKNWHAFPYNYGAVIVKVAPNSPADMVGLQEGDVILQVNSKIVDDPAILAKEIKMLKPGEKISLKIWRNGEEYEVTAKLADSDEYYNSSYLNRTFSRPKLKRNLQTLNNNLHTFKNKLNSIFDKIKQKITSKINKANGIELNAIDENMEKLGLEEGDIVIAVNGKKATSLEEVKEAISKNAGTIIIQRNGQYFKIKWTNSSSKSNSANSSFFSFGSMYTMESIPYDEVKKYLSSNSQNTTKKLPFEVEKTDEGLLITKSFIPFLQTGDIILKVNGEKANNISQLKQNKNLKLLIKRGNSTFSLTLQE